MPGLVSHPKHIVWRIAHFNVPQLDELSELTGTREVCGEILETEPHLSHIKIADAMEGVPRGRKAARSA